MDIGKVLQDARIAKNLSLEMAAQETNIRKTYLEAIEQNDFAALSGDVFVKGIIRTYGNYLGLDGAQLVEEYKATGAAPAQVNKSDNSIRESNHVKVRPSFKSNRDIGSGNGNEQKLLYMILGIIIIVLVASGGLYFYLNGSGKALGFSLPFRSETDNRVKEQNANYATDGNDHSKTEKIVSVQTLTEKSKQPEKPEIKKTDLKITSTGRCWVRVTEQTGKVLFEGNLMKGESKIFSGSSDIIMRIGNLKDLQIEHNGKVLPFETANEVVTRIYTPKEVQ